MPLNLALDRLPAEGETIQGELDASFLDLTGDSLRADQPARYQFHIQRLDDLLHVQGDVTAPLQAECGRCLQTFPLTLTLEDHHLALDLPPGIAEIDLAPALREDLLLELPAYPRCEDGDALDDGSPRICPAADRFQSGSAPIQPENGPSAPGNTHPDGPGTPADPAQRWKALDDLGDLRQFPDPSPDQD